MAKMTVSKGVRKCILHYFQLLLLVPFLICFLYLKKKYLVHINYFGESVFTTAVVAERWGREDWEVSEIANYIRNIWNIDFPVDKWIKCEKEWTLFFILWDECNCSIKFNDLCMCINECEPNHLFKRILYVLNIPTKGQYGDILLLLASLNCKNRVNWKIN